MNLTEKDTLYHSEMSNHYFKIVHHRMTIELKGRNEEKLQKGCDPHDIAIDILIKTFQQLKNLL